MRLIDADAFGNRMYHEVFEKDSKDQRWDSGCWIRYRLFDKVLEEQPTVEQPERMRGEWIEREVTHIDDLEAKDIISAWQSCKCSVCGRYDTKPYMYYFNAPKYCSWCGAEMEVSE